MGSSSDGDESVLADESHRSPQRLCRRRRGKDREEKPAPPPEERATRSASPPIDGTASRGTKKLVVDLIAAALLVREREIRRALGSVDIPFPSHHSSIYKHSKLINKNRPRSQRPRCCLLLPRLRMGQGNPGQGTRRDDRLGCCGSL